jgi:hypothetical protein
MNLQKSSLFLTSDINKFSFNFKTMVSFQHINSPYYD